MRFTLLRDMKDRRGRIYSKHEFLQEIKRLENRSLIGELGETNGIQIDFSRVSHQFLNLHFDNYNLYGDLHVFTKTPSGIILQTLLDNKIPMTTNLRAVGMVNKNLRVSELQLVSFDMVHANEIDR